jgi:adenylate cyclase
VSGAPNVNEDFDAAKAWLVEWLLGEAWTIRRPQDLVSRTCEKLIAAGIPILTFRAFIRILHPNYFGVGHRWDRETRETQSFQGAHDVWDAPHVQKSPVRAIALGEDMIRVRIEGVPVEELTAQYAVLGEYAENGATDYVMMALLFSDGMRQGMSVITDRPGGFSDAEIALLDTLRPYLARLTEIQSERYLALTLLNTYVGARTGREILRGTIRRGSGQTINAVIWLTDLRNFTDLSNRLPREALLDLLNAYFDLIGEAVAAADGEILKFIGDSALAIQPLETPDAAPAACRKAIGAARAMRTRLAEINAEREAEGKEPFDFGLGLHVGDVLYGNIGTEDRLDFTVIGPAVNEAARLESFCSRLGEPVLLSQQFVDACAVEAVSLGKHEAKGLAAPIELFRPAPE